MQELKVLRYSIWLIDYLGLMNQEARIRLIQEKTQTRALGMIIINQSLRIMRWWMWWKSTTRKRIRKVKTYQHYVHWTIGFCRHFKHFSGIELSRFLTESNHLPVTHAVNQRDLLSLLYIPSLYHHLPRTLTPWLSSYVLFKNTWSITRFKRFLTKIYAAFNE